jgi:polyhydroxybutyrate depolymerase
MVGVSGGVAMSAPRACCCSTAVAALVLILIAPPSAMSADEVLKFEYQGIERQAIIHEPAALGAVAAPLVISLHGLGQTTGGLRTLLRLDATADREGFRVLYPEAVEKSWSYGRPVNLPMPTTGIETVNDIGFIRLLIDELIDRKIADPTRIYVTGISRGGLMAFTLACALSDRIAAAAPLITGMTEFQREDCRPTHVRSIMALAGTADTTQSFVGAQLVRGRLLSVADTMNYWSTLHGCTSHSARVLPHRDPADRSQITVIDWNDCRDGGRVRLYRVEGGGHQVPSIVVNSSEEGIKRFGLRNRDIETADEIWAFFNNISRRP